MCLDFGGSLKSVDFRKKAKTFFVEIIDLFMMGVVGIHKSKTVAISCENFAFIRIKKQTMYLMMGVP